MRRCSPDAARTDQVPVVLARESSSWFVRVLLDPWPDNANVRFAAPPSLELAVPLSSVLVASPQRATSSLCAAGSFPLPVPEDSAFTGFELFTYRARGRNPTVADRR